MSRSQRDGMYWCWIVIILCLLGSVAGAAAQEEPWEQATRAGGWAFQHRHYAEAAQQFQSALVLAEAFQPNDARRVTSLVNLAAVYQAQGQYPLAEPLYQQALVLQEQLLGPDNPQLIELLEACEGLSRRMHPVRSLLPWSPANKLAIRVRRIQAREARSQEQFFPGSWSNDENSLFSDGGS
jgi:tetratricopeptide (TPR) repeat protein